MTPEQYAKEWEDTAAYFKSNGHYSWISQQLGNALTVIEIGCGSGHSTAALANSGKHVVSIEINHHAINRAFDYLTKQGITAKLIDVDETNLVNASPNPQVQIIQANIFDDKWLDVLPKGMFDALACWMTGASPNVIADQLGVRVEEQNGTETPIYRKNVQRRCFALGRALLKPQGLVQIADRIGAISWQHKDKIRELLVDSTRDLAGQEYQVEKSGITLRKLEDFTGTSSIQYYREGSPQILLLSSVKSTVR